MGLKDNGKSNSLDNGKSSFHIFSSRGIWGCKDTLSPIIVPHAERILLSANLNSPCSSNIVIHWNVLSTMACDWFCLFWQGIIYAVPEDAFYGNVIYRNLQLWGWSFGDGLKLCDKTYLVCKLNYVKHSSYLGVWWVLVCSLGSDSHQPRQGIANAKLRIFLFTQAKGQHFMFSDISALCPRAAATLPYSYSMSFHSFSKEKNEQLLLFFEVCNKQVCGLQTEVSLI